MSDRPDVDKYFAHSTPLSSVVTWLLGGSDVFSDKVNIPAETDAEKYIQSLMTKISKEWVRDQPRYMTKKARPVVQSAYNIALGVLDQLQNAVNRYGDQGWGETPANVLKALKKRVNDFKTDYVDKLVGWEHETVPLAGFKDAVWLLLRDAKAGIFALEYTKQNAVFSYLPDAVYRFGRLFIDALDALITTFQRAANAGLDAFELFVKLIPYLGVGIAAAIVYNQIEK